MSNVLGFTASMNKVGEKFRLLHFLNRITPRANRAQGIDFSIKLITEMLAYTTINGMGILKVRKVPRSWPVPALYLLLPCFCCVVSD